MHFAYSNIGHTVLLTARAGVVGELYLFEVHWIEFSAPFAAFSGSKLCEFVDFFYNFFFFYQRVQYLIGELATPRVAGVPLEQPAGQQSRA